MKVSTAELENRQLVLDIEVEDERVEKAMDQAYRRMVGRLNVPGFRKGKAPRSIVERMVGREALLEDAIELLVPAVFREAIDNLDGIKPAAQPHFEVVSVSPLQVKATVPLAPRVELGDLASVRVTPDPTDVTDAEVDEVVQKLRERHAEWAPVERPVNIGDRVALDIRGAAGERSLLDSKDTEFVVDPEGAEPAPGFSHQIVGMEADQSRTFALTLPENSKDRDLSGQQATFDVTLHWVKERQLPPLDDGFVSTLGQYESVQELHRAIVVDLKVRKEDASNRKLEREAVEAAVSQAKIELPPQLVDHEAEHLRDRFVRNLDRQGITFEQYLRFTEKAEADFRADVRAEAEASVKRAAVLDALAGAEGIEIADAEVDEEIRQMGDDSPESRRMVKNALARQETRERVRSVLRERKAVRRLVDIATGAHAKATASSAS